MSHLQNEYVVQAAVKELLTEFDIRVRSVPLHLVSFSLPELKTFENSKLGQMAIPEIGRNFGPRYVCKLLIEWIFLQLCHLSVEGQNFNPNRDNTMQKLSKKNSLKMLACHPLGHFSRKGHYSIALKFMVVISSGIILKIWVKNVLEKAEIEYESLILIKFRKTHPII